MGCGLGLSTASFLVILKRLKDFSDTFAKQVVQTPTDASNGNFQRAFDRKALEI